ncbi:MAG: riboflavin synthase [Gemmatimonadota bacterium]
MFTGLIETIGTVAAVAPLAGAGRRLTLAAPWAGELGTGESVAIDGACLTVVERNPAGFAVEATGETVGRTILGAYETGRRVHLERALAVGGRLGGHFVQGHIDAVATVQAMEREGENRYIHLALPPAGGPLVAAQGSLAVNGVSLTVLTLTPDGVRLMIIPHTWKATTMARWKVGDRVNVEYDLIARYINHIIEMRP